MSAALSLYPSPSLVELEVNQADAGRFAYELVDRLEKRTNACTADSELCDLALDEQMLMRRFIPELWRKLQSVGRGDGPESLMVRGLPSSLDEDDLRISKVVSAMLARAMNGRWGPMQYAQEKGGLLWSILKVNQQLAGAQSGQGAVRFNHHTDFAWLGVKEPRPERVKPRFNILAGIRNPGGTLTTYASAATAAGQCLSSSDLDVLSQPVYRIPIPAEMGIDSDAIEHAPIMWRDSQDRWAIQLRGGVEAMDPRHQAAADALRKLQDSLHECEQAMCIQRGDYALVNNIHGTHSRNAIDQHNERLLLRLYSGALSALRARTNVFDARLFLRAA